MTMPSAARHVLAAIALLVVAVPAAFAGDAASIMPGIRVDIPVALKSAKVVFNIDQPTTCRE
jgi:predicted nucleotidyltransferase